MKWLTLLFKYAGKWHMDVFIRDACENDSKKTIRMWLLEATKLSIERQGLREKDCDVVAESMAFELFCMEKPDGSGAVGIRQIPIVAVSQISLL